MFLRDLLFSGGRGDLFFEKFFVKENGFLTFSPGDVMVYLLSGSSYIVDTGFSCRYDFAEPAEEGSMRLLLRAHLWKLLRAAPSSSSERAKQGSRGRTARDMIREFYIRI